MWEKVVCSGRRAVRVYFQHKSYYRTPDHEATLLKMLALHNMSEPDLFITETSIWSEYISKEWQNLTFQERRNEEDYYLQWVADHFGNGHTEHIWLLNSAESPGQREEASKHFRQRHTALAQERPKWSTCLLGRETLSRPPSGMTCTHGGDGPIIMVTAQMLLRDVGLLMTREPARAHTPAHPIGKSRFICLGDGCLTNPPDISKGWGDEPPDSDTLEYLRHGKVNHRAAGAAVESAAVLRYMQAASMHDA
jgi:hypothetical protein